MSQPGGNGFSYRHNAEHHEAQSRLGHLIAYYAWTLALFGERFEGPAADAGAGAGHFSNLLAERVGPLLLMEGGVENIAALHKRFSSRNDIAVVDCDLAQCEGILREHGIRSIFCLDVLEHLPDDVEVLKQFHTALPPGGKLYVKVPALSWLYGPIDEASGHYRRYSHGSLRRAMVAAGFRVDKCRYMNLAGVAPYFLKARVLKRGETFSQTFSMAQINCIQRMMPVLRLIDQFTGPPLGLSVICVATRT